MLAPSADALLVVVPNSISNFGERALRTVGPALPLGVFQCTSIASFKL